MNNIHIGIYREHRRKTFVIANARASMRTHTHARVVFSEQRETNERRERERKEVIAAIVTRASKQTNVVVVFYTGRENRATRLKTD